jgi:hypothetical protein
MTFDGFWSSGPVFLSPSSMRDANRDLNNCRAATRAQEDSEVASSSAPRLGTSHSPKRCHDWLACTQLVAL